MIVDTRFRFLTSKQRAIAEIAQEKGFVTLGEVKMFYSSRDHWTRALSKLVAFSILIPDRNSNESNLMTKYIYNQVREEENIQKTLKQLEEVKDVPLHDEG